MQKYGQTDKQKEIEEAEKKQAALLKDLPEAQLAAQRFENERRVSEDNKKQ